MAIVVISERARSQRLAVQEDLISEIVTHENPLDGMSYLVRMSNGSAYNIDSPDATPELVRLAQGVYRVN